MDSIKARAEEIRDAEREGVKAYMAKQRINTNPFWPSEDKAAWVTWREGWYKALNQGYRTR